MHILEITILVLSILIFGILIFKTFRKEAYQPENQTMLHKNQADNQAMLYLKRIESLRDLIDSENFNEEGLSPEKAEVRLLKTHTYLKFIGNKLKDLKNLIQDNLKRGVSIEISYLDNLKKWLLEDAYYLPDYGYSHQASIRRMVQDIYDIYSMLN